MTADLKRNPPTETRRPQGRIGADEILAQVQAVTGGEDVAPVSQRNVGSKGLRAYFQPLTGKRRTGLVALRAIRTRVEGQVRTGDVTAREDFTELVASVRAHGVLQPVGVTWDEPADCFWTDFGHRRIAAARAAGLEQVPAVISVPAGVPLPEGAVAEQQLVENLQRTQLPAVDVAYALKRLVDLGSSAAEVARRVGRSPSWVTKHLKLLELPKEILAEAEARDLGHEALYTVAIADVPAQMRKTLLDIAACEGRPALNRAVQTLAMTGTPSAPGVGSSRVERDARGPTATRAMRSAATRALAAVRHLESLLDAGASTENTPALSRAAARLAAALRRFLAT